MDLFWESTINQLLGSIKQIVTYILAIIFIVFLLLMSAKSDRYGLRRDISGDEFELGGYDHYIDSPLQNNH